MVGNRACCSTGRTAILNEGQLSFPGLLTVLWAYASISGSSRAWHISQRSLCVSQGSLNLIHVRCDTNTLYGWHFHRPRMVKQNLIKLWLADILTHDHDVCIGQNGSVSIGGLTLIDSTVRNLGIMYNYGVTNYPPVSCWGLWNNTKVHSVNTKF